jgi:hypothetical protein
MSLIENEQTKLLAAALNTGATSCFTVGVLAPMAAVFYNVGAAKPPLLNVAIGMIILVAAALVLHWPARNALRGLKS